MHCKQLEERLSQQKAKFEREFKEYEEKKALNKLHKPTASDLKGLCTAWAHTLPQADGERQRPASSPVGIDLTADNGLPATSVPPMLVAEEQVSRQFRLRDMPPGATTIMIRNIPATYTQEHLLREWVPDGTFNLFYAPCNGRNMR